MHESLKPFHTLTGDFLAGTHEYYYYSINRYNMCFPELYCERSEHAFVYKSQSSNSKSRKDNAFETFGMNE